MENKKYKHFERILDSGDDLICFRTSCACCSKDHTIDLSIEYDNENKMTSIGFNTYCSLRMKSHSYYGNGGCIKRFFAMIKDRIFTSLKVLFIGYFSLDEEFIFKDSSQVEELVDILKTFPPEMESRINDLQRRIKELESDGRDPTN